MAWCKISSVVKLKEMSELKKAVNKSANWIERESRLQWYQHWGGWKFWDNSGEFVVTQLPTYQKEIIWNTLKLFSLLKQQWP